MKTIYFITSNKGKYSEAKEKLRNLNITLVQHNIGYPEIQADCLEDVIHFGVEHIQKNFHKPFIIEDAGLFIDSLDGFPGVYSAYVYHTIGCKGILRLLKDANDKKRTAHFESVYAFKDPDDNDAFIFRGICPGKISSCMLGISGFGYDPIFVPTGNTKTFAQMSLKEKNSYSHRGKAIDQLIDFFKKINNRKF